VKDSLILQVSARYLLAFAIPLSLFVLLRGHNAPGGGFIGGFIAAIGLGFHAMAQGAAATRRLIRLDPIAIGGMGLLVALGTATLFDIGVYLVVMGFALAFLLPVPED
jgi:multicomponent Na+:H+ antiporter subunit B